MVPLTLGYPPKYSLRTESMVKPGQQSHNAAHLQIFVRVQRLQGSEMYSIRVSSTTRDNQMEKSMENDMENLGLLRVVIGVYKDLWEASRLSGADCTCKLESFVWLHFGPHLLVDPPRITPLPPWQSTATQRQPPVLMHCPRQLTGCTRTSSTTSACS